MAVNRIFIMKLTGKCKEGFLEWVIKYYRENRKDYDSYMDITILNKHYRKTEVEQNALIIEYFDGIGVYINAIRYDGKWKPICNYELWDIFNTRTEAINAAIEEANEIINL